MLVGSSMCDLMNRINSQILRKSDDWPSKRAGIEQFYTMYIHRKFLIGNYTVCLGRLDFHF